MTQEEKAKAYDEAIERAKSKLHYPDRPCFVNVTEIFPELKESEDEKIRKALIDFFNKGAENGEQTNGVCDKDILAWLEKQGTKPIINGKEFPAGEKRDFGYFEEKSADKVEPKFRIRDWITNGDTIEQISEIDNYYRCFNGNHKYGVLVMDIKATDDDYHIWTIQDAKDGDVLAFDDNTIVIFKDLYNATTFHSYCHIEDGLFNVSKDDIPDWWEGKGFQPATKEQRDNLMKAMANAGYTFDFEKKELKKIENEIEIPFGAKDSELQEATYYIPKGFHAEIEGKKVVIKKGEYKPTCSEEDETRLSNLISLVKSSGENEATKKGFIDFINRFY